MNWSEVFKFLCSVFGMTIVIVVFVGLLVSPLAYLDGRAKSRWIKETRGIDIPWYEAMILKVHVNSIDADVSSR